MSKPLNFTTDQALKEIVRRWWDSLLFARKDRRNLWDCLKIDDVYRTRAFYELKAELAEEGYETFDPALARMVGVVSLIRKDRDGERLGILLSERVRFEDVVSIEKINDQNRLFRAFREWIERLKGEAPVVGTADVVYWWDKRKPNRKFFYHFFSRPKNTGTDGN